MQNNITNEFARLTPRGTDLSTDVPWTNLTLASGFSIGSGEKLVIELKMVFYTSTLEKLFAQL